MKNNMEKKIVSENTEKLVEPTEEKKVGEVYLHVSNSGVTFQVLDTVDGPVVEVTTSSFGNLSHTFRVQTTTNGIKALAKLFDVASKRDFSQVPRYCHSANIHDELQEDVDATGQPVLITTYYRPEPAVSGGNMKDVTHPSEKSPLTNPDG